MTTIYQQPGYQDPGYQHPGYQQPGHQHPGFRYGHLTAERRRIAEGPDQVPERLLWQLWKKRAARQQGLRTQAGRRVRVLYPGRTGASAGPDFRDALLEIEGTGLVRGDVEIHRRQRDWAAHGHTNDPNYNGVVIHAALEVESDATRLANGVEAPVLSLGPLLAPEGGAPAAEPLDLWEFLERKGIRKPENAVAAGALLDWAGDQRFLGKASSFLRFIQEIEPAIEPENRPEHGQANGPEYRKGRALPDQVLYEALLEGLGYRHNRQAFLKLAYLAPYAALVRAAGPLPPEERAEAINRWLLAVSGLEPSADRPPPGLRRTMAAGEWRLFRVRPSNHPVRRIRGAAALSARFMDSGLLAGLVEAALSGGPPALVRALSAGGGNAAIGVGRARELAVNAVLPFCHAYYHQGAAGPDQSSEQFPEQFPRQFPEQFMKLFRAFPGLPANELTREMAAELLSADWRKQVVGARRQQGLLHLAALLKGAA